MLESVKLIRFKQFRDTEIRLLPFTVLTGENNCGKTTVLQAVWLALHSLRQGKLLTVDPRTLQTKVSSTGYYMFDNPFIRKDDLNGLFYNRILRGSATYDENSGAIIELSDDRQNRMKLHMRELFKNLNVKVLTPESELKYPDLQNYAPLFISGFTGLVQQEERSFSAVLESKIESGDISANVRNIVLDLKLHNAEKYRYLENLMREEFGFGMKEIHYYETSERYVVSEYEEMKHGETVNLEFGSCGSGTLQILQTLAVILRYCPNQTKVVLIDEPELHLHSTTQKKFVRILRDLQRSLGIQIILATNSDTIVQCAEEGEVILISSSERINREPGNHEPLPDRRHTDGFEQLSLF